MYFNFTDIMSEITSNLFIPDKFYCNSCGHIMTDEDSANRLEKYLNNGYILDTPAIVNVCQCDHEEQKVEKKKEKLMVWHIPQIPGKSFHVPVDNIEEAKKIIMVLADYDAFQLKNNIKPDYANVSGLLVYDDKEKEWYGWLDEDGNELWDLMKEYPSIAEQEKRLKYDAEFK